MKFLIIAIIALSAIPCFSQTKAKGKEKQRTCRIIFLERPKGAPGKVQLFDGTVSQEVLVPTLNFSPVIKLPAGDIVLGMTPDAVLEPENFPKGAPTVKVAAKITDLYLVVVSDPKNQVFPVRMLLVDVSEGQLKPGQTLWINFSKYSITGKLGNESLIIPPKAKVVGKAPLRDSGYYQANFLYKPNSQSPYLPIMKKSWWFDVKSKHLGFIVNTGTKLPKIFTLRDKLPPKLDKKEKVK